MVPDGCGDGLWMVCDKTIEGLVWMCVNVTGKARYKIQSIYSLTHSLTHVCTAGLEVTVQPKMETGEKSLSSFAPLLSSSYLQPFYPEDSDLQMCSHPHTPSISGAQPVAHSLFNCSNIQICYLAKLLHINSKAEPEDCSSALTGLEMIFLSQASWSYCWSCWLSGFSGARGGEMWGSGVKAYIKVSLHTFWWERPELWFIDRKQMCKDKINKRFL